MSIDAESWELERRKGVISAGASLWVNHSDRWVEGGSARGCHVKNQILCRYRSSDCSGRRCLRKGRWRWRAWGWRRRSRRRRAFWGWGPFLRGGGLWWGGGGGAVRGRRDGGGGGAGGSLWVGCWGA